MNKIRFKYDNDYYTFQRRAGKNPLINGCQVVRMEDGKYGLLSDKMIVKLIDVDLKKIEAIGKSKLSEYMIKKDSIFAVEAETAGYYFKLSPFITDQNNTMYPFCTFFNMESVEGKPFFEWLNRDNVFLCASNGLIVSEYTKDMALIPYEESFLSNETLVSTKYFCDEVRDFTLYEDEIFEECITLIKEEYQKKYSFLITGHSKTGWTVMCSKCKKSHLISSRIEDADIECVCGRHLYYSGEPVEGHYKLCYVKSDIRDYDDVELVDIASGKYEDIRDIVKMSLDYDRPIATLMKKHGNGYFNVAGIF